MHVFSVRARVRGYVCMHTCEGMYQCTHVCIRGGMLACVNVSTREWVYVYVWVSMCVCEHMCIGAGVCMRVRVKVAFYDLCAEGIGYVQKVTYKV